MRYRAHHHRQLFVATVLHDELREVRSPNLIHAVWIHLSYAEGAWFVQAPTAQHPLPTLSLRLQRSKPRLTNRLCRVPQCHRLYASTLPPQTPSQVPTRPQCCS